MRKLFLCCLFVIFPFLIFSHPFDQVRADSNSYFTITGKSVDLKLKFPVHAYINLWVKSREDYDKYVKTFLSEKEKKKIKEYIKSTVQIFDKETQIPLTITSLKFEKDQYLSDPTPISIIIKGTFTSSYQMHELYIFNKLFDEGRVPHFGQSEIEYKDAVYDFLFEKNKFFKLKMK